MKKREGRYPQRGNAGRDVDRLRVLFAAFNRRRERERALDGVRPLKNNPTGYQPPLTPIRKRTAFVPFCSSVLACQRSSRIESEVDGSPRTIGRLHTSSSIDTRVSSPVGSMPELRPRSSREINDAFRARNRPIRSLPLHDCITPIGEIST